MWDARLPQAPIKFNPQVCSNCACDSSLVADIWHVKLRVVVAVVVVVVVVVVRIYYLKLESHIVALFVTSSATVAAGESISVRGVGSCNIRAIASSVVWEEECGLGRARVTTV